MQKLLFCLIVATLFTIQTVSSKKQVGIIFLAGMKLNDQHYSGFIDQLNQQLSQNNDVKIISPDCKFDSEYLIDISVMIESSINQLVSTNFGFKDNIVVIAHSTSSYLLQKYLEKRKKGIIGNIKTIVLINSSISKKKIEIEESGFSKVGIVSDNNIEVISINGNRDGIYRITKQGSDYFHQIYNINQQQAQQFIYFSLDQVNHQSIIDDQKVPIHIVANDLTVSKDKQQIRGEIIEIIEKYIESGSIVNMQQLGSLNEQQYQTRMILKPIIEGLIMEGSAKLKPACNSNQVINPADNRCIRYSLWSQKYSMVTMAGDDLGSQIIINNTDTFHPASQFYPIDPLPKIYNNCNINHKQKCYLQTLTVSENYYYGGDDDLVFKKQKESAWEIKTKMMSRQAIHIAVGHSQTSFQKLDVDNSICKEINQKAIDWAYSVVDQQVLKKYLEQPDVVRIQLKDDTGPYNTGPLWIWKYITYTYNQSSKTIQVRSPMSRYPMDYWISLVRGYHFCKLLSPFRVIEHIYVDSQY